MCSIVEADPSGHEVERHTIIIDSMATLEYVANRTAAKTRLTGTRQNIPVVEAAKAGHGRVVRMLLQRWGSCERLGIADDPDEERIR